MNSLRLREDELRRLRQKEERQRRIEFYDREIEFYERRARRYLYAGMVCFGVALLAVFAWYFLEL